MTQELVERLRDAATRLGADPVAVAQLAQAHGSAAFSSMLVLLAMASVLPLPGVGNITGLAVLPMALALWRGRGAGGLPERLAALRMPARLAGQVLRSLAGVYALCGRWSRRRLCRLALPGPRSWLAVKIALMGVLIFLPIPLGNILPAIALGLLGLALAFEDGLLVLLATVFAGLSVLYTAALGAAAWWWGVAPLMQWLGGWGG